MGVGRTGYRSWGVSVGKGRVDAAKGRVLWRIPRKAGRKAGRREGQVRVRPVRVRSSVSSRQRQCPRPPATGYGPTAPSAAAACGGRRGLGLGLGGGDGGGGGGVRARTRGAGVLKMGGRGDWPRRTATRRGDWRREGEMAAPDGGPRCRRVPEMAGVPQIADRARGLRRPAPSVRPPAPRDRVGQARPANGRARGRVRRRIWARIIPRAPEPEPEPQPRVHALPFPFSLCPDLPRKFAFLDVSTLAVSPFG